METRLLPTKKYEFIMVVGVTTFVVIFLTLLFVFIIPSLSEPQRNSSDNADNTSIAGKKVEESVQIPFQYTVNRINDDEVVLVGDTGEMSIPRDDQMVRVYTGTPDGATEVGLGQLAVGDQIVLKLVFGEAAWLYIVN